MTEQVTAFSTQSLLRVIGRNDVKEFNFSPLFTSLFFSDVVTTDTKNILLDSLDIENVVMSIRRQLPWPVRVNYSGRL